MPSIHSIAFKALLISAATSHLATAYPTGGNVIFDSNGDNPGSLQTPEVSINNNAIQQKNGDTVKLDKPALDNRDVSIDGNFKYDGSNGSLETSDVSIDDNVVRLSNGNTIKLDKPVINNRDVNDEDDDDDYEDEDDDEDDGGNVLYDGNSRSLKTSNVSINDNVIRTKNGDTVKLDKPVLDSRDESDDQDEDEDEVDENEDEDEDEDVEG